MATEDRFSVGSIECRVLHDGGMDATRDVLFGEQADEEVISEAFDERGNLYLPYDPLLITAGGRRILVDTGAGDAFGPTGGRLPQALADAQVAPEDVDIVLLTHAHPDHIGGLTSERDGQRGPTFPNARHVIQQDEWSFWTSESTLAQIPDMAAAPARTHLPPLDTTGLIEPVRGETEVVPGVWLVPAPGHTVGHAIVALVDGNEKAFFLADAVFDTFHLTHPDVTTTFDMDADRTVRSRKELLDRAIEEGGFISAYHTPARGYVERSGSAYRWQI